MTTPLTPTAIVRGFRFRPATFPASAHYTITSVDLDCDFYIAQYTQKGLSVAVPGYYGRVSTLLADLASGKTVKMRKNPWL